MPSCGKTTCKVHMESQLRMNNMLHDYNPFLKTSLEEVLQTLERLLQDCGSQPSDDLMKREPWLDCLCRTEHRLVNLERVAVVEEISGRETLEYVLRTLSRVRAAADRYALSSRQCALLIRTLQWSETAKGGTAAQRAEWESMGLELSVHNLASAEIYLSQNPDAKADAEAVACLIRTHGLLGQAMRGEILLRSNAPLRELLGAFSEDALERLVLALNECVIGAVSDSLWQGLLPEAERLVPAILQGTIREYPAQERLARLCPWLHDVKPETVATFSERIFPDYELWYFPSAFRGFREEETAQILGLILADPEAASAKHLNFHPLSATMYYDYEGKRHINVYRLRVIQKYLRDRSNENVRFQLRRKRDTLYVDFVFHPACEKLVDFCVAAERSGLLSYEKAITILMDVFGFRLDAFDRLNNEDKYLSTMNDAEESTKASIADYVTGGSVVDVGSGGGVMLDLLEQKRPEAQIIGTDISDNVIAYLEQKRIRENHRWRVLRHNFVDGKLPFRTDTVVFSSILHEIYSYTEGPDGNFDLNSVRVALKNACESLNPGGRLVIRDGVKTARREQVLLTFLDEAGMPFFENYRRDFRGLKDLPEEEKGDRLDAVTVRGDVNYIREFLYTYTWGAESYAHEVQEQFGYLTLKELCACLEDLGMQIRKACQFLEPGYADHLLPKIRLTDCKGEVLPLPDSNLIVVAEKRDPDGCEGRDPSCRPIRVL